MDFIIVGMGGFFGSISRYLIYLLEKKMHPTFPAATLFINSLGCLVAGFILSWVAKASPQNKQLLILISVGYIGSFTTFSTFSAETFQLIRTNQMILAVSNVLLSVGLGILAVWLGAKIAE
jgi:CrcB protein